MTELSGFPMSNGSGDTIPENVDQLLAGGEPNQERIAFEQPSTDPDAQSVAEDHQNVAAEQAPAEQTQAPAVDPIVSKLQEAIGSLTPEQKAALMPPSDVEITFNGEKLMIPPDKQIPLMQMGANYSEKMRQLAMDKQAFESEKTQISERALKYDKIEETIAKNPEWWQHVQAEYQKFSTNPTNQLDSGEMTPALRAALSKVTDLEAKLDGFLGKQTQEIEAKQVQAEDQELEQQIKTISKEYPDFDWMTADEKGLVLADRIVVHAHQNGINNFRAAARDFLFDDLVSRRELKAKEEIGKQIQSKTKAGVVTKSKTSGLRAPKDLNKSYEQLMAEGLAELG